MGPGLFIITEADSFAISRFLWDKRPSSEIMTDYAKKIYFCYHLVFMRGDKLNFLKTLGMEYSLTKLHI